MKGCLNVKKVESNDNFVEFNVYFKLHNPQYC